MIEDTPQSWHAPPARIDQIVLVLREQRRSPV
jgi:hypothetical protein